MSERKQKHAGVAVEFEEGEAFPVAVCFTGVDLRMPTLESAAALRDALTSFLAFHEPRSGA